jgi:hypothetical protein
MLYLHRGDVVLSRSSAWHARAIRSLTGEPVSHAAIVTTAGPIDTARVVESAKRVREAGLYEKHAKDHVFVYRPRNLSPATLDRIASAAERRVGEVYGGAEFITQALDGFFGITLFRRANPILPGTQCSGLVAAAFGAAGLSFGVADYAATPADIARFCAWHSDKYELLIQERLDLYVAAMLRQAAEALRVRSLVASAEQARKRIA